MSRAWRAGARRRLAIRIAFSRSTSRATTSRAEALARLRRGDILVRNVAGGTVDVGRRDDQPLARSDLRARHQRGRGRRERGNAKDGRPRIVRKTCWNRASWAAAPNRIAVVPQAAAHASWSRSPTTRSTPSASSASARIGRRAAASRRGSPSCAMPGRRPRPRNRSGRTAASSGGCIRYWRYQSAPGGVIVELESLTLSRDIPWAIRGDGGADHRSHRPRVDDPDAGVPARPVLGRAAD